MSLERDRLKLRQKLHSLQKGKTSFEQLALDIFQYQATCNQVYAKFLSFLKIEKESITSLELIPSLPIQAFRNFQVISGNWKPDFFFESSGTSNQTPSKHYIRDEKFYHQHSYSLFKNFCGEIGPYSIFALLPSYIERGNSSLVSMVSHIISQSENQNSGFYLDDVDAILKNIQKNESAGKSSILFGVGFALMDFALIGPFNFKHLTIIETGGMKGRKKEIPKTAMLQILKKAFPASKIYSEYGMTELMSQAYSLEGEPFLPPFSMRILPRQIMDPMSLESFNRSGVLQIIDLANIDSCAFILSEDVGKVKENFSFTLDGRLDQADMRGCHLMFSDI